MVHELLCTILLDHNDLCFGLHFTLTNWQLSELSEDSFLHCLTLNLLQAYEVMILGVAYFLYAYARPYKATLVNIIEIVLLAYLGVFLMLSQDLQQQTVFTIQLAEPRVDLCGKATLLPIGPAWIVLGVLYFLPVTVLLLLLGRWFCSRVVHILRYVEAYKHFMCASQTALNDQIYY